MSWNRLVAERQGFEPWIPFRVYTLSKRAPSATRPSLHGESVLQKRQFAVPARTIRACQTMLTPCNSIVAYWRTALREAGRRVHAPSCCAPVLLLVVLQLLGQVVRNSHFADGMQLSFKPVDMVLFVIEDLLREITRTIVPHGHTQLDTLVQAFH